MNRPLFLLALLFSTVSMTFGQDYTSYFTGDTTDVSPSATGGICMMGGATEDDNAMIWFLQRANGGDVLVLRASGSDGYNEYMYSELGVSINSVETIVFDGPAASQDPYIHQRIQRAEAIWFAGGDQWNYISYWRDSPVDSLINIAIAERNIVIGGTSAGMAILGGFYFSAQNGTVTSGTALADPYDQNVTVDSLSFLQNHYLSNVITDTHYDDPDRKGRHVTFLSRILIDYGVDAKGIACDEYTAVCIDTDGMAMVYGGHPTYDDNAYFIQSNCELSDVTPEECSTGNPLTWNLDNTAIMVYAVKGVPDGSHTFDLNDWETGTGGAWEYWYVDNGLLNEAEGVQPSCLISSTLPIVAAGAYKVYPNPGTDLVTIEFGNLITPPQYVRVVNQQGQVQREERVTDPEKTVLRTDGLVSGAYYIEIFLEDSTKYVHKLLIK